jgi:hypothetical protein
MNENTRELVLAGLRQALQAKVATIWTNVTLAGEANPAQRFHDGVIRAAELYEQAVAAVEAVER